MELKTFFDNFGTLAEAPNGVKKLREMILQLAVQGKLVEQDPKDEPASVLLEKIAAEKARLVKDGKIKKQKPFPPIDPREVPYELPMGWNWVRSNDIFDVRDGTHDTPKYVSKGFPLITSKNISNGLLDFANIQYISAEDHKKIQIRSAVDKFDILFAMIGSIGNPVIVNTDREFSIKNVALYKYYSLGLSCPEYLQVFLKVAADKMKEKAFGGVQSFVSLKFLRTYLFPLPPLNEQKLIVAKVGTLMALCDDLEVQRNKTHQACIRLNDASVDKLLTAPTPKQFNKSWQRIHANFDTLYSMPENVHRLREMILQLAVQGKLVEQDPNDEPAQVLLEKIAAEKARLIKEGKIKKPKPLPPIYLSEVPFELPDGWAWVRLGSVGFTQTGTTPSKSNPRYFGKYIPFIKPADISENSIAYDNEGLSEKGLEQGRFIKAHSVLMVCIGGSIGKVNFIERDCSCNQQINTITPFKHVSHELLNFFMRSPFFQTQVIEGAPKTTLPILSKGKWELLPLPMPPGKEQKRIVTKVGTLMALCNDLENKLSQTRSDNDRLLESAVAEVLAA